MAVLFENSDGFFLCHRTWSSRKANDGKIYILKKILFDINCPFLFDLQAAKIAKNWSQLWTGGLDLSHCEEEDKDIFVSAENIIKMAKELHLLQNAPKQSDYMENNRSTREFVKQFLVKESPLPSGRYHSSVDTVLEVSGNYYLFPENSEAVVGDVSSLQSELSMRYFDLIVIDPPWRNKMVRRKRKRGEQFGYAMMEDSSLSELSVGNLLSPGGIVVVWCTNKALLRNLVLFDVFKKWEVEHMASWYWVKITQNGEFTTPPAKDKKPFELLLVGRKMAADGTSSTIPAKKILVSVPASVHSFKPPLNEVLRPFLPPNARCLEIFARSLIPNWVSYGFEAFKLQNVELFETCDNVDM